MVVLQAGMKVLYSGRIANPPYETRARNNWAMELYRGSSFTRMRIGVAAGGIGILAVGLLFEFEVEADAGAGAEAEGRENVVAGCR